MICNQFQTCLETTCVIEHPATTQKTNKKKKSKRLNKTKRVFSEPACGSQDNQKKCIAFFDRRSQPSCTEKGKTYTLDASGENLQVLCFHIDGGVVDSNDCNKCDYAFFLKDKASGGNGRAIFIELKGKHIRDAMKQLNDTLSLDTFKDVAKTYKKIYGRIVITSSVPRIRNDNQFMDLKERFMDLGGNLKISEINFVENYADLDQF